MTEEAQDTEILGMAEIARAAFHRRDLEPFFEFLRNRVAEDPSDAAAMMDLSMVLQVHGQAEQAAEMRGRAVALQKTYRTVHGDGSGPRLLALVTPGDFMANTPVDFLLAGSNATLLTHHVDAGTDSLAELPAHDAALLGIAEAPEHRATLERLERLLPGYPGRLLNGAPARIAGMTRDGVSELLSGIPGLLCPPTRRASRDELAQVAGGAPLTALHPGLAWPLVLRPVGTHAGEGMEKVADAAHLDQVLAEIEAEAFYLAPFVDYRGPHGLYAKARVVLIDGRPYPVHYALSEHWIVHYLSADMAGNPARRNAEQSWFESFDDAAADGFAHRHAAAFAALQERVGLDYWGLDCAETPDGTLLVFEIDTALIVHDMDDPRTFPYKVPAMRRVFEGFQQLAFAPDPK